MNATLEYYLEPNELLQVDPLSGTLHLIRVDWLNSIDMQLQACVSGQFLCLAVNQFYCQFAREK